MTYTHIQSISYVLAGCILIFLSIRNVVWNAEREQARVSRILSVGVFRSMWISGFLTLLLGLNLIFVGPSVRGGIAWKYLGFALVALWLVLVAVALFGKEERLENSPALNPAILKKWVTTKRISGVVLFVGAAAWIYSGLGYVI